MIDDDPAVSLLFEGVPFLRPPDVAAVARDGQRAYYPNMSLEPLLAVLGLPRLTPCVTRWGGSIKGVCDKC